MTVLRAALGYFWKSYLEQIRKNAGRFFLLLIAAYCAILLGTVAYHYAPSISSGFPVITGSIISGFVLMFIVMIISHFRIVEKQTALVINDALKKHIMELDIAKSIHKELELDYGAITSQYKREYDRHLDLLEEFNRYREAHESKIQDLHFALVQSEALINDLMTTRAFRERQIEEKLNKIIHRMEDERQILLHALELTVGAESENDAATQKSEDR